MSPTLRSRRKWQAGSTTIIHTPRAAKAMDGDLPLFNKRVQPVGFVGRMLAMFERRVKASKITGTFSKAWTSGRTVTSRLSIKRKLDARHIVTRQYKKAMRGVSGALGWKDFDTMKVDKTGHLIIPASPLRRQLVADSQRAALGKTYKVHPQPLTRSFRRKRQREQAKAEFIRLKLVAASKN